MANPVDEEGWEEIVEELLDEAVEEEEEMLPPGYLAADGPYKQFCTCQEKITCSFCSWFHLIRECPVHGDATKKPPKPCFCSRRSASTEKSNIQLNKSTKSQLSSASLGAMTCECRKPVVVARCNCLDDVVSSSTDSAWKDVRPSGVDVVNFDDVRGEDDIVAEDTEIADFNQFENEFKSVSVPLKQSQQDGDGHQPRPCTCNEEPVPRSGSSSELESSIQESSDSDTSSAYDMGIFSHIENTSSDITSSENSSAAGTDIDWTTVRWIHNASDRSVESVSDDDYEQKKRRRAGAKKLQARPRRRRQNVAKQMDKPTKYQYLVVQQSRKKKFLDICKDKKDQPHSYSYHLMSIL